MRKKAKQEYLGQHQSSLEERKRGREGKREGKHGAEIERKRKTKI